MVPFPAFPYFGTKTLKKAQLFLDKTLKKGPLSLTKPAKLIKKEPGILPMPGSYHAELSCEIIMRKSTAPKFYFFVIYPSATSVSAESTAPPAAPRFVLWERPTNFQS